MYNRLNFRHFDNNIFCDPNRLFISKDKMSLCLIKRKENGICFDRRRCFVNITNTNRIKALSVFVYVFFFSNVAVITLNEI